MKATGICNVLIKKLEMCNKICNDIEGWFLLAFVVLERLICMEVTELYDKIEKNMTSQRRKIIKLIYEEKEVCSGDIANKLGVRPNSMSNALERMKNLDIPFLESHRNGRRQIYSLTKICQQYVHDVLAENMSQNETSTDAIGDSISRVRLDQCINDLKDWDPSWENKVKIILEKEDQRNDLQDIYNKICELLHVLSDIMKTDSQDSLVSYVENIIANTSAREYIIHIVRRRHALDYLWEWMEKDERIGYEILSLILEPRSLMVLGNEYQKIYALGCETDKIKNLCFAIQELMTFAHNEKMGKTRFLNYLAEEGASINCGYYMYEKYQKLLDNLPVE